MLKNGVESKLQAWSNSEEGMKRHTLDNIKSCNYILEWGFARMLEIETFKKNR